MKQIVLGILLFTVTVQQACGTRPYDKYWVAGTVIGSIPNHASFKYYFEPQLRLIEDAYVFNQSLLLGGLGYEINQNVSLFAGTGWILTKTSEGMLNNERRLWQQVSWSVIKKDNLNVMSRTRLEERKRISTRHTALRFRERLWVRIPFKEQGKYFWSCFDEIFFNLNHPAWVSSYVVEQNRAFMGIAVKLSQSTMVDVGYLNQYLRAFRSQQDNVLLLSVSINR